MPAGSKQTLLTPEDEVDSTWAEDLESHAIDSRLIRKLLVPVHVECVDKGFSPGVRRLCRHLRRAVDEWPVQVMAYDFEAGTDEYAKEIEALLVNYYEDNWHGEIEADVVASVLNEMRGEQTKVDAQSSQKDLVEASGDEWDMETYADEDDED